MITVSLDTVPMTIGGVSRVASNGETIDTVNPATGQIIARIPNATVEDVDLAVAEASAAFKLWRRTSPEERAEALLAFATVVEEHAEELSALDVAENGSPIREMRKDAAAAVSQIRYYAGLVLEAKGETIPTTWNRLNYTLLQPYGVVGRIVPFNHPLMFAASKIAAPIAAGNTVIVKPSEYTSLSALRLAELSKGVFPDGVFNVVTGYGNTAGDAMVRHPGIRRMAFTGSAETGRHIQATAASVTLKTITLELGGKNPLVVFSDADIDKAIEAAQRGMNFSWQGQSCGSTSRLIVQQDIYNDFVEALAASVEKMRSGMPDEESTQTGAIVNQLQFDKVSRYLRVGVEDGATVVAGGHVLNEGDFAHGYFVRPTVFKNVDPSSRLAQEEVFGPILATMPFTDYDNALSIANGVRFGLTASVFSESLKTTTRFARDVEAGYVWVNEVSRHVAGTGFGGVKDSGIGREEGLEELLSYTQAKNVHINIED
ncbi:aldehyde dehydrogenase [Paenarthrobacter ureafaciens]|uniref:aldehyde dehydrogenase family protein n=1 Tax=Paenarthrobacter TaxID=1742992 RepID=UPI0015B7EC8F|nr:MULTISPECIES: aldehyde dehydrogenase family protein [Paenarthrobacter]NWL26726.1 aldehyde dehydrogenase [Paenarthrobacter ureafaciens]NWL32005.1 aldehyde dehydrogenase [Paenarthrobacter nitroguajacolicus]